MVEIIAQGTHEGFRRYQATPGEPATAVDKTKKTRRAQVEYRETLRDAVKTIRPKIDYNKALETLYENRPETRVYNSKQVLLYLKDLGRQQKVSSRVRKRPF